MPFVKVGHRSAGRVAVAMIVGATVLVPGRGSATPGQESDPDQQGGASSAQVAVDIDVQTADRSTLEGAADDIQANVRSQREALDEARQTVTDAEAELTAASAAVEETQAQIDELVVQSDRVAVEAFVNPPADNAIDLLTTESASDAAVKQSVRSMQADRDASVLEELAEQRAVLEERKDEEEAAQQVAEDASADARVALEDLRAAASQQTQFAVEIESRVEQGLTEVETLRNVDPELADELAAEQDELVGLIEGMEIDAALEDAGVDPAGDDYVAGPSVIEPVSGGVVEVSCPAGGSIQVAGAVARDVQSLLNLSAEQGLTMCGGGWRDPQEQVSLRRAHCGSSEYAIYQAPSSACSPPTARPGTSMHEQGLAIDFTCAPDDAVSYGDACHTFLNNNAADFGLYNLPSEPWHWSTDGT